MIPSLIVSDVRAALVEFLASTFALADDEVRDELTRFLTHHNDGIFRGPYLRVRTPFKAVEPGWRSPLDWMPDEFHPYLHQATAFERLSAADGRVLDREQLVEEHEHGALARARPLGARARAGAISAPSSSSASPSASA